MFSMKKLLKDQKAQGSIELLLILGAVIFVALLVGFTIKSILGSAIENG